MHDLPESRPGPVAALGQSLSRRLSASRCYPSEFRYNLTIGSEPKFVWFRVAKAGTRTIFDVLRGAGAVFAAENAIFNHYRPRAFDAYFKFAFVRHPVERFISCWRDRVVDRNHFDFAPPELERMRNLEEFVAFAASLDISRCDVHLRLQSRLIDLGNVDFLGRMENFDADLATVAARLGFCLDGVPRRNTSSRTGADVLSHDVRRRIARIYERDMRFFGYHEE